MRIGFISTYPPIECGIATYTKYLTDVLADFGGNEVYVVSEFGGKGENVFPVFHGDEADMSGKAFKTMMRLTPDIVHIQHEYAMYGPPHGINCLSLFYRFRLAGIPVVTTLHSVYETFSNEQKVIIEPIIRASDAVIVHEQHQKDFVRKEIAPFDNIHVIPHGAREIEIIDGAKKKMGLNEKVKTILLCGYFRPTKGLERIVRIFPRILEEVNDAVLLVAGKTRGVEYAKYRESLIKLINDSAGREKTVILKGQFPQNVFDCILCAGDIVPMPYLKGAQSGVFAHCLAFGRPVVVSPDVRSLRETVRRAKCGFVAESDEEFVKYISNILNDEKLWLKLSENARRYVKDKISWRIAAEKTYRLYQRVLAGRKENGRYIEVEGG